MVTPVAGRPPLPISYAAGHTNILSSAIINLAIGLNDLCFRDAVSEKLNG